MWPFPVVAQALPAIQDVHLQLLSISLATAGLPACPEATLQHAAEPCKSSVSMTPEVPVIPNMSAGA